jgi:hypothetical protein
LPSAGTLWFKHPVGLRGHREAQAVRHLGGEAPVHLGEHPHHALPDGRPVELAELEPERLDDVPLLRPGLAVPEERGLAEVVEELLAPLPHPLPFERLRVRDEAAHRAAGLERTAAADRVRVVGGLARIDGLPHEPVALIVVERRHRPVDRDLVEVGAAEARELGVGVREQAPLQQRIVREVDTGHHVAGMECHLLGLREEAIRVPVQGQPTDALHRDQLLGHDLGRVEQVEVERVLVGFRNDLQAELPLRVGARFDGLPEIAAVEVGILAGDLERLVPEHGVEAQERLPVELHEPRGPLGVDQLEGVDAEALHHPEAPRDGAVGHRPHDHVHGLGHQRHEVPEGVVRGSGLGDLVVGLRLDRVDEIRELHRVLDEEDGDIVSHEVEVPLVGVELDREAPHVARQIARAPRARHRGEAHEHRRLPRGILEERGPRVAGQRPVDLEVAVGRRTPGVHHALRDALVIEVGDLLPKDEVLQERRAAGANLEGILVVVDPQALVGGEELVVRGLSVLLQLLLLGSVRSGARSFAAWPGRGRFPSLVCHGEPEPEQLRCHAADHEIGGAAKRSWKVLRGKKCRAGQS